MSTSNRHWSATAAASAAPSRDAILGDIAAKIPGRVNARTRQVWLACLVIGVIAFVVTLLAQPQRAWGAFAINTVLWLGIAQGGVVLACAIRLTNGRWGGPIMRIAESLSAYLPFGIATMAVLLIAGIWSYLPWTHGVEPHQAPYLNVPFLYIRMLGGLAILWWLSRDLVKISLRTDAQLLKNHVSADLKPAYEKLSDGWRGDAEEVAWQRHRLAQRAPQICVLFAVVYTLMAWDLVMSLTPDWISSLFGWWFFMGAFLSGIAMTSLLATRLRERYRLQAYVTTDHFWDVGKTMFAMCIFWAYLFWSQYLPIWYANLPEETGWVFLRFEAPWRVIGFTVFALVFAIPFLGLLNKYTKTNPFWLMVFSLIVLTGMWMERHVLVMPSLNPDTVWMGLQEIGVTIGFAGLFGLSVQGFLAKYPVVKVDDVLSGATHPEH